MKPKNIYPKIYKLYNSYQNYDWGTKNEKAFIPNFIGDKVENNLPYAELWIGAHPKLSSKVKIDNNYFSLNNVIEKFPNEILGENIAQKFNYKLPFLLKILSADKALSIQAHPDKLTAEKLHERDPLNYPDDNHKPEIAIALDRLNAIVGFKSFPELVKILTKYDKLADAGNFKANKKYLLLSESEQNEIVKKIYSELMNTDLDTLKNVIHSLILELKHKNYPTNEEQEFLKQYNIFGYDVGLLSILLFNYLELAPDEAIITDAGIPHAYLKGNIIECMANSDNVVRAGLTRKYKDVETLLSIIKIDQSSNEKIIPIIDFHKYTYPTRNNEFQISSYNCQNSEVQTENNNLSVKILLVTQGNLIVEWREHDVILSREFERGESFLIPGNLKSYKLSNNNTTKFIMVEVPEAN